MAVQVLQFRPRLLQSSDWTQQELAEFYRVESALLQAGLRLETDRGVSDEGDPWFIFCRQDSGDVFIHFARIDGEYVIDGAAYPVVVRGRDFKALVRDLIGGELVTLSKPRPRGANVFMHPAALLIALVGAAFFHSGKADAAESQDHRDAPARRQGGAVVLFGSAASESLPMGLDAVQTATLISGIAIGVDQLNTLPVLALSITRADVRGALFEVAAVQLLQDAAATPSEIAHSAPVPTAGAADALMSSAATVSLAVYAPVAAEPIAAAPVAAPPLPAIPEFGVPAATLVTPLEARGPVELAPGLLLATPTVLPDDEAGAVIRAAEGSHLAPVLGAAKLPDFLADLIGHGQRVDVGVPTPAPEAPPPVPTEASAGSGPATPAPPSASTAGDPPAATSPSPETPATPAPPVASAPDAAHVRDAAINATVAVFMGEVAHWQVVVTGHDVVMYDTDIFGRLPAGTTLDSVTYTFSDGSTVSLVGTSTEVSHLFHGP